MARRFTRFLASAALLVAMGAGAAVSQTPSPTEADPPPMTYPGWGFNPADLDKSVKPGDDFDAFVNGKWKAATSIPTKYPNYGVTTNLRIGSERAVRDIIEKVSAGQSAPGTIEQRIGDMYRAYLDVDSINRAGLAPVKPYLDRIAAAKTHDDLVSLWSLDGYPRPLGGGVNPDPGDPNRNIMYFGAGGTGLPDRDNYLVDNDRNREMRAKYLDLLTFMLGKAGYSAPRETASSVYEFEKKIAAGMWDRALARNPELSTNRLTYAELLSYAGDFPLKRFLDQRGFLPTDRFNVGAIPPTADEIKAQGLTPEQLAKLGGGFPAILRIYSDTPVETWKAWMTARMLTGNADVLPTDIDDAAFAFYGKFLQGLKQKKDRWQRAVSHVESNLGEAVGKVYVQRHFPESSKAAMEELVGNLRLAMSENLKTLPWMTPTTRAAAKTKLDGLAVKIGYPRKFETYEGLMVSPTDPFGNRIAAGKWEWAKDLLDLRAPVDPEKWRLTPQTVNAYYMPTANHMVYPAAYLQPPNFNPKADPAVNYGAIGSTIGHEIGHGFDDSGSRYDGVGLLRNWWTAEDQATFRKLGEKLETQYNAICPLDGGKTCINGKLTLGENIADLGGISMAYRAYHISLKGKKAPVIDGLTGDQRFFIAYAQKNRSLYRDDYLRQLMQTDPHSPGFARTNAVLRNFDPWYKAFNVKPGNKLYLPPEQRVHIW